MAPEDAQAPLPPWRDPLAEPPGPAAAADALRGADGLTDEERVARRLAAPTPVAWLLMGGVIAGWLALLAIWRRAAGSELAPAQLLDPVPAEILRSLLPGPDDLARPAEWWRFALAPFLETSVVGVLFQLLWIGGIGRRAERLMGGAGALAAFFAGAFTGGAVALVERGGAAAALGSYAALLGLSGARVTAVRGRDVPEHLVRGVRRSLLSGLIFAGVLTAAVAAALRASGYPLAIPWKSWLAGLAAGMLAGLTIHARVRRPDPVGGARSTVFAVAVGGGGLFLLAAALPHLAAALRASEAPGGWEARIRAAPLERRAIPRFGVSLDLPIGWMREPLGGEQAKYVELFRPAEGGAMVQVIVLPKSDLGDPLGTPDILLDRLVREHAARGEEVTARPFERARVAGRSGWRIDMRYRSEGRPIEEIRYLIAGKARSYSFVFVGAPGLAQALAAAIAGTVEIDER
jgi:membrane associated rhomboid family serine protease